MTEEQFYLLDKYINKIKTYLEAKYVDYIYEENKKVINIYVKYDNIDFKSLNWIKREQVGDLDFKHKIFINIGEETQERLDVIETLYDAFECDEGTFEDITNNFLNEFENELLLLEKLELEQEFRKDDKDKLLYNLLPSKELEQIVKVLTVGAKKYGIDNWKKCDDITRYINALYRHLEAYRQGEMLDKEDNLHHLAHLACNALFLLYFENNKGK